MMKLGSFTAAIMVACSLGSLPAEAKGCIKGAIAGGVAGHYAGHGVLGAVGGCIVGRKLANSNAAREREAQLQQKNPIPYDGSSSRDPIQRQTPGDARYSSATSPQRPIDNGNVGGLYNGGAYSR